MRSLIPLLGLLLWCSNLSTSQKPRLQWDYLVFSQEWPPTICMHRKCNITKNDFNIHGIWPTILPTKEIAACHPAPKFNITNLDPILKELEIEWSDLYLPSNPKKFWKHEWDKHGTCAWEDELIKQEVDYYRIGMELKKRFSSLQQLSSLKVIPTNHTKYPSLAVTDALAKLNNNKTVILKCVAGKMGVRYLSEIRYCLDPKLQLIDCPRKPPKDQILHDKKILKSIEFRLPVSQEIAMDDRKLAELAKDNADMMAELMNDSIDRMVPWQPVDFGSSDCSDAFSFLDFP